MVALVKRINANGKLIDGIGTQMHLNVSLNHTQLDISNPFSRREVPGVPKQL